MPLFCSNAFALLSAFSRVRVIAFIMSQVTEIHVVCTCLQIIGFAVFEFALASIIVMLTVARLVKAQGANMRRYISVFTGISLVALIIFYVVRVGGSVSAGFTDIMLLAFANMTAFVIVVQVCLYGAPYQRWSITIVDAGCVTLPSQHYARSPLS